jgi:hypothetical protein
LVRTCAVPAGDIGTVDFKLTTADRDLLKHGTNAAAAFLDAFDPTKYRNTYGRPLAT